jgi:hypothetical protein
MTEHTEETAGRNALDRKGAGYQELRKDALRAAARGRREQLLATRQKIRRQLLDKVVKQRKVPAAVPKTARRRVRPASSAGQIET